MPAGGHTTVIQRILERRAARATVEETTATIAVMLRVMPPPRALLVCQVLSGCVPRLRSPVQDGRPESRSDRQLRRLAARLKRVGAALH